MQLLKNFASLWLVKGTSVFLCGMCAYEIMTMKVGWLATQLWTKGQLISERNFGVFKSSKKNEPNNLKDFCFSL